MTACQSDNFNPEDTRISEEVMFAGFVENSVQNNTRALTQDPLPVQFDSYDVNFYIEMESTDGDPSSDRFAIYKPKSGQAGFLDFKVGYDDVDEKGLVWEGKAINYNFWSWTVPWLEKNSESESLDPSFSVVPYTPSSDPISFQIPSNTLQDTTIWQNGRVLEKFIGAKTGPVNYKDNGSFVTLQYRHLVSKIFVKSITLKTSGGSSLQNVQGHITFVNMPDKFTLYPKGKDGQSAPVAETDYESKNNETGLKYYLANGTDIRSTLYICPELNFSEIEFFVELDGSHGKQGVFWGSFADVKFEREPGTDYDNPMDPDNPESYDNDSHILHAGEMMIMNLYIQEGSSPGMSCYIHDWDEVEVRSANHHNHKGIYESGEANEIAGQSKTASSWETKFELYGDGYTDDGKGIFHIYGDVMMAYPTNMKFEVNKDYIIDGMGYTIQFKRNEPTPTVDKPKGVITVGRIKDAYLALKDNEGVMHTLYVDNDFNVWIVDNKTGDLILTTLNLDSDASTEIDFDNLESYIA